MRTKKLLSILLAVLLIVSTFAVTVMSYDKPFKNGYSYSAKDSKGYVKMEYLHNTSVHVVNTFADNLINNQIKVTLAASTIGKTHNKTKDVGVDTRIINKGSKTGVGASDWRSKSKNVYYSHTIDVYGSTGTYYVVSTIGKTVG